MTRYRTLFSTFFKIGLFTIGGGLAMLPLIEREVVEKNKWIDRKDYLDLMAIAQSMPGIFAFNFAVLIGFRVRKYKGSFITGLATILPSFFIILLIAICFTDLKDNSYVIRIFKGMRPAVVALILVPMISTAKSAKLNKITGVIALASMIAIGIADINPVYIILIAGFGAIVYGRSVEKRKHLEKIAEDVPPNNKEN